MAMVKLMAFASPFRKKTSMSSKLKGAILLILIRS